MWRIFDWCKLYVPFVLELDNYIRSLVIKRIKKKLKRND